MKIVYIHFKGSVRVVSGDPPCKDGTARYFTTLPLKALSNQMN